jgi:hypothetical protein
MYGTIKSAHVLALSGIIGMLLFIIIRLFFFALEKGITSDGAESTLKFEQEGLVFLETFVNKSIKDCRMSIESFERLVYIHYGAKIHWDEENNSGSIGAFGLKVTKKDSCIEEMRFDETL